MTDRQPKYPRRILITPEDGSAQFYATWERADEPTDVGTPINKNTLLKDATALLLGGNPATMLPDDALRALNGKISASVVSGSYTGDGTADRIINLGFTPRAILVLHQMGYLNLNNSVYGGLAVTGSDAVSSQNGTIPAVSIVTNGFQVYYNPASSAYVHTNINNHIYNYIAFL